MRKWPWMIGVIGALLLPISSTTHADESSAAEAFRAGTDAFSRKEYRGAALAFEVAYREHPHGAALYNAAKSWLAAGNQGRAADAYASSLEIGGLDATQEEDTRKNLAKLENSLGTVSIDAPRGATVSIAHLKRVLAPVSVHLEPGPHSAQVVFPDGTTETKEFEIKKGDRLTMAVEPTSSKIGGTKRVPVSGPKKSILPFLGAASLGGGMLAGMGVIALGLNAQQARDAFNASGHTNAAMRARAVHLQDWTNVMIVTMGGLGALGMGLVIATWGSDSSTQLRFSPGYASLTTSF